METFVSDLREFVEALYKIQSDHSWRPVEEFYNLNTEPLKKAVYMMLDKHDEFVEYISSKGTEEDIEELNASLREKAPRMFFITMACFLSSLNDREKDGEPISHDLVRWYREQGWKFPEFRFEKIGTERLNENEYTHVDGNVTSEEGGRDTFHSREPSFVDA
jgi:hypothetical protein